MFQAEQERAGKSHVSREQIKNSNTANRPSTNGNTKSSNTRPANRSASAPANPNSSATRPTDSTRPDDDCPDTGDNSDHQPHSDTASDDSSDADTLTVATVGASTFNTAPDPLLASTLLAMLAQVAPKAPDRRLIPATPIGNSLNDSDLGSRDADPNTQLLDPSPTQTTESNTGSITLPKGMKPASGSIHPPPADNSLLANDPSTKSLDPNASPPPPVVAKSESATTDSLLASAPPDGTTDALSRQRMKFVAEKNEIAGRTVQKLPAASLSDSDSSANPAKLVASVDPEVSGQKQDAFDPATMLDWANKPAVFSLDQGTALAAAAPANTAVQVERVAHLVNQQVVTVRQSGANNLAVSLKLDAHTELFLQLTHHDGQIQASLRCERGSVAGLDQHWGDLQESLAKQNVQLLPLETKSAVRATALTPAPETTGGSSFHQSSQNSQRQIRELSVESTPVFTTLKVQSLSSKTPTKIASPQGWEALA